MVYAVISYLLGTLRSDKSNVFATKWDENKCTPVCNVVMLFTSIFIYQIHTHKTISGFIYIYAYITIDEKLIYLHKPCGGVKASRISKHTKEIDKLF